MRVVVPLLFLPVLAAGLEANWTPSSDEDQLPLSQKYRDQLKGVKEAVERGVAQGGDRDEIMDRVAESVGMSKGELEGMMRQLGGKVAVKGGWKGRAVALLIFTVILVAVVRAGRDHIRETGLVVRRDGASCVSVFAPCRGRIADMGEEWSDGGVSKSSNGVLGFGKRKFEGDFDWGVVGRGGLDDFADDVVFEDGALCVGGCGQFGGWLTLGLGELTGKEEGVRRWRSRKGQEFRGELRVELGEGEVKVTIKGKGMSKVRAEHCASEIAKSVAKSGSYAAMRRKSTPDIKGKMREKAVRVRKERADVMRELEEMGEGRRRKWKRGGGEGGRFRPSNTRQQSPNNC